MTTTISLLIIIGALAFICKLMPAMDDKRAFAGEAIGYTILVVIVAGVSFYLLTLANAGQLWAAVLALFCALFLIFSVVYQWKKDGSEAIELVPYIALIVLVFFVLLRPIGEALLWLLNYNTLGFALTGVPLAATIVAIGMILADYFGFRAEAQGNEAAVSTGIARAILTAVIIAAIIALVCMPLYTGYALNGDDGGTTKGGIVQGEGDSEEPITIVDVEWRHFYNLDLQGDEDALNDYNFGPTPSCSTVSEYDADFRMRLKQDPALAAADTAWLDAIVGTRYLGEFYESCSGDWAKTINMAKDRFSTDQQAFYADLDAFFAFLDSAVKVSVVKGSNLDDQMYMNPYTTSGIPDVIVMETPDHEGTFLVYTFVIKGTPADVAAVQNGTATPANNGRVFEVAYRIECGYQPTNVERVMGITPQKNPTEKSSKVTPKKEEKGDTPTPTPEPKKKWNKDPSKAPKKNTEPNDDPGPGASTNNGVGSTESTADKPTNSNHYSSYDEYRKDVEELKQTNQTQKTGKDSNQPSTPAPSSSTKIDNNGDKGTGYGGANDPTPVTQPAKEASTGKEINESPGEAWGGPSD